MRRNNLFAKFIITLTLVALLTIPVGRVTGVFALAVTPELQPVYDTKVIQLQDYVDNVLTDAQVGMFNTLMGTYAASQAGLNDYELEYPYNDSDGVIGWLQRMGQKLYDTIIEVSQNPIIKYTDPRTYLNVAVDYALGVAQSIRKYATFQDLMDDIDASNHYFIPIDPELQASINSYVGLQNGFYDWQFDSEPFLTQIGYITGVPSGVVASEQAAYMSPALNPVIRVNYTYSSGGYNGLYGLDSSLLSQYHIVFIDSDDHKIYICNESGDFLRTLSPIGGGTPYFSYVNSNGTLYKGYQASPPLYNSESSPFMTYDSTQYDTLVEVARAWFDNSFYRYSANFQLFFSDFVDTVYAGTSWALKHQLYNLFDLDLAENESPSYDQIQTNMLIDIKGLLANLVNNVDLYGAIIANLFNTDGTLNIDPTFLKVSIELPDDIVIYGTEPMPVDLNDIQYYTENEYLDVVRERVDAFSDTVGSFVAFWHNTDYEIVYAVFGSALIVLLGAFIGKWGHS